MVKQCLSHLLGIFLIISVVRNAKGKYIYDVLQWMPEFFAEELSPNTMFQFQKCILKWKEVWELTPSS